MKIVEVDSMLGKFPLIGTFDNHWYPGTWYNNLYIRLWPPFLRKKSRIPPADVDFGT
jgi:hypothetical protein